jgi:hypothetical protein
MMKFLKKIFGIRDRFDSKDLVEETRVIESDGTVDRVSPPEDEKNFSDYYLKGILRSYMKRGLIKEYPYLKKWVDGVEEKEFSDKVEFNPEAITAESESIKTLKNVWRTRYYTTEDRNLQKFMTEK